MAHKVYLKLIFTGKFGTFSGKLLIFQYKCAYLYTETRLQASNLAYFGLISLVSSVSSYEVKAYQANPKD